MPLKNGNMTPQERIAAQAYGETGSKGYAAWKAGYSRSDHAATALARPDVAAEAQRIALDRIANVILPLATAAHERLLTSGNTKDGAMVQAIKLAYERAGVKPPEDGANAKEHHAMTMAELVREQERLHNEFATRAKLVEAIPVEPDPPEGAGLFD